MSTVIKRAVGGGGGSHGNIGQEVDSWIIENDNDDNGSGDGGGGGVGGQSIDFSTSGFNFCSSKCSSLKSPVSPRKSIRQYSSNSPSTSSSSSFSLHHNIGSSRSSSSYEDSYLLYKGRRNMFTRLMFLLSTLITWIQKLLIKYSHSSYLSNRLSISLLIIVVAGLLNDYFLGHSYSSYFLESIRLFILEIKTEKTNPLNVYFVKLGWLWTFISLIPFLIFTRAALVKRLFTVKSKPKTPRRVTFGDVDSVKGDSGNTKSTKKQSKASQQDEKVEEETEVAEVPEDRSIEIFIKSNQILKQLAKELAPPFFRLLITTLIWYYSVNFFEYLGNSTGHCKIVAKVAAAADNSTQVPVPPITNRHQCIQTGNRWIVGFDISGHIFLMTFSNLIRIEEFSYLFQQFEEFSQYRYLNRFGVERTANFASPYQFEFGNWFKVFALLASFLMVLVTLVWDFMSLQTSLFYHTLLQKICGFAWAMVSWLLTYRLMFANKFLQV